MPGPGARSGGADRRSEPIRRRHLVSVRLPAAGRHLHRFDLAWPPPAGTRISAPERRTYVPVFLRRGPRWSTSSIKSSKSSPGTRSRWTKTTRSISPPVPGPDRTSTGSRSIAVLSSGGAPRRRFRSSGGAQPRRSGRNTREQDDRAAGDRHQPGPAGPCPRRGAGRPRALEDGARQGGGRSRSMDDWMERGVSCRHRCSTTAAIHSGL